ncbi:MAG TPA: flagellar basal body protein [Hypericibacter adhaerens]|jgi:flagellar basal-body rod protein FlgB|uniref:Flagellar basal body rod protein FlgB n=1 Tax=Hypericibacter adhaerens TaxID=2602016 RepID=A0A5J6N8C5_9PROT|nr:flagellar basal body protein [Hypericibacter adhaerens]QEX23506.1 flagellar basal body rod protein FlgB [Hypericibacter adhaerens]HWA46245.1 flagellar basal body protein [Hypericibacter adhaerens]
MDLSRIPLFSLALDKMAWLNKRQEVLAHNIANADTPDFQPQELKPLDARAALSSVGAQGSGQFTLMPVATDPNHIVGPSGAHAGKPAVEGEKKPYETTLAGNQVVLEEQMVKVAETQANYEMATNLYKKYIDMVKIALGRGSSA